MLQAILRQTDCIGTQFITHVYSDGTRTVTTIQAPAPQVPDADMEIAREAELCPLMTRDQDCNCRGKTCGPNGRRAGQTVNILDCVACTKEFRSTNLENASRVAG
jgi:hypothetical protein